jgi:hypothetical protein
MIGEFFHSVAENTPTNSRSLSCTLINDSVKFHACAFELLLFNTLRIHALTVFQTFRTFVFTAPSVYLEARTAPAILITS